MKIRSIMNNLVANAKLLRHLRRITIEQQGNRWSTADPMLEGWRERTGNCHQEARGMVKDVTTEAYAFNERFLDKSLKTVKEVTTPIINMQAEHTAMQKQVVIFYLLFPSSS